MAFINASKGSKSLAKLKMPPKRMEAPAEEGSEEEEAAESPDEEQAEQDAGEGDEQESAHDLSEVSDDDLLAELKKRGLDKAGDSDEQGDDQSQYGA